MSLDPTTARLRSALAATAAQWFRDRTLALDLALDGRSEPSTLPSTAGSPPGDAEEIRPTSAVHCTDLVQVPVLKTEGHSAGNPRVCCLTCGGWPWGRREAAESASTGAAPESPVKACRQCTSSSRTAGLCVLLQTRASRAGVSTSSMARAVSRSLWLAAIDSLRMATPSPRAARSATASGALASSAIVGRRPCCGAGAVEHGAQAGAGRHAHDRVARPGRAERPAVGRPAGARPGPPRRAAR